MSPHSLSQGLVSLPVLVCALRPSGVGLDIYIKKKRKKKKSERLGMSSFNRGQGGGSDGEDETYGGRYKKSGQPRLPCHLRWPGGGGTRPLGVSYEPQRSYWLWDSVRTSRWLENWSPPSHMIGVFFSFSNVCVCVCWGGSSR